MASYSSYLFPPSFLSASIIDNAAIIFNSIKSLPQDHFFTTLLLPMLEYSIAAFFFLFCHSVIVEAATLQDECPTEYSALG